MIHVLWDAFLSLIFRAIFTAALFAGVNWFVWAWFNAAEFFKGDEMDMSNLIYLLSGILILVGAIGTFRRGAAERNFSILDVGQAAGVGAGLLHLGVGVYAKNVGKGMRRTLRRFPVFESLFLGILQILLWPLALYLKPVRFESWIFVNGAILGTIQILWGLTIGRTSVGRHQPAANTNDSSPTMTRENDFQ